MPEPWLGHIKLGQAVKVRVDSFPDREFPGQVEQINRAAEFTPRNVQTVEERIKQVIGVKVRLDGVEGQLRAGMSADVFFLTVPTQLAPLLAERVLRVDAAIASGVFASQDHGGELILRFHSAIAGDLVPDWAGRWREAEVRVGEHHPPPPYRVPMLAHDYGEDLRTRLENAGGKMDELLLELLAFAEGRLLSIHPFNDFNGRVTRLILREMLRRLQLPPVDLVPTDEAVESDYFFALRAGDHKDWPPLMRVWEQRFEQFGDLAQ